MGVMQGAWMLKKYLEEAGFEEVELVETDGYPGIWASIDVEAAKTLVSYGFFDSRPVGPRSWTYKPFCGALIDHPQNGRVIIGRGASSPKGPLVAWVNSLEAMIRTDTLPVNVMLLLEGEEILCSPHYGQMLQQYRENLKEANAVFAGGMTQGPDGLVSINLGYRGFLVLELEVSGEHWGHGPIGMSVHSSLKNVINNPASRLAHVLASLTDEEGAVYLVEGLDDGILPPSKEDERLIENLITHVGSTSMRETIGLSSVKTVNNLEGRELLMKYLYKPSMNVSGIYSGYTGPGTETSTVPERAVARLDLRLPPGLACDHAVQCIEEHLARCRFSDVKVTVLAAHEYSRTPVNSDIVQAVLETYRSHGLKPSIWPYQGGGGPWSTFQSELGIPIILNAGLGGGGRRDRGDEYLIIEGNPNVASLLEAEKSHIEIVRRYAAM